MKLPVVAIVGRPNVGKSTLFNKLALKKISIVEDTSGITRDRVYTLCTYRDYKFHLIDTGGIESNDDKDFNSEIKIQANIACDEADVIVFVVDGKDGLTNEDRYIKDILLRYNKKVIVAINKVDSKKAMDNVYDFYELGFSDYINISSEQSVGISDLLDLVVSEFREIEEEIVDDSIKFAVIGRPNVGKSSLINALLNEDRCIVSNIAGTTRDSVDTKFVYQKTEFTAIDTAGLRKKGRIYENVEKYSYIRSIKAIERCDVCIIVIDASTGIIEHDKHIASYAIKENKGLVLVVNKWDTVKDTDINDYKKLLRNEFQFMTYVPIVFLSALTKKRIHTLLPEVIKVNDCLNRVIKTSVLNEVILEAFTLNPPPSYKGRRLKIYFSSQVSVKPQIFAIQVNSKNLIHFSYERYLENKIREAFDFSGCPITLKFKNKNDLD